VTNIIPTGSHTNIVKLYNDLNSNLHFYFFGKEFLNIFSPKSLVYCLLDPRFKELNFLPFEDPLYDEANQLLLNMIHNLDKVPEVQSNIVVEAEKYTKIYGTSTSSKNTTCQICHQYKSLPQASILENPHSWWQKNEQLYPLHATLARKFLSRPATSVPCERMWSEAGNIVSEKRSSLDKDSVCMLVVSEHNLRELERFGHPFTWKMVNTIDL